MRNERVLIELQACAPSLGRVRCWRVEAAPDPFGLWTARGAEEAGATTKVATGDSA
jgi:hypothetical protein